MRNLLLRSLLLALVVIPFVAARDVNARRGLKRAVFLFVGFCLFYMFALRFIYSRLPA